ncbi:hypothetical protein ACLOJK_041199 [Asimina triloba]
MSALVDIWTSELAKLRERLQSTSTSSGSSSSSDAGAVKAKRETTLLVLPRRQPTASSPKSQAEKVRVVETLADEATVFMLMDRFSPC